MSNKKTLLAKLLLTLAILTLGVFVQDSYAQGTNVQNVPQGFQSSGVLQPGIIVMLNPKNGHEVEPVTMADQKNVFGVVISPNEATISISNNSNLPQTFVASNGEYDVLVSTQDGSVNIGDYVGVSSIDGVGMAASDTEATVIGKAITPFNGKSGVISTATLKGSGKGQNVSIGTILVNLVIAHNPNYVQRDANGVPEVLSTAAKVITDKPVGALRIYAALLTLAVTIFIAGAVLYIGIRSSITAIGRNPLAKKSISKSMITVIMSALIVFIIGMVAVYLLLKL